MLPTQPKQVGEKSAVKLSGLKRKNNLLVDLENTGGNTNSSSTRRSAIS